MFPSTRVVQLQSEARRCTANSRARSPNQSRMKAVHVTRALPPGAKESLDLDSMLLTAVTHAKANEFEAARASFQRLTEVHPHACKAYVSWAQMEKRMMDDMRFLRCRNVLQAGTARNPDSACLIQAWGLMELQRGNFWAALMMLERAVKIDPKNSPVLKWVPVRTARQTVGSKNRSLRSTPVSDDGCCPS